MMEQWRLAFATYLFVAWISAINPGLSTHPPPDLTTIIQGVDASVKNRIDRIADYTVTEHYQLFRGQDEAHPAAEMLVKTFYRKQSGKSYTVLSESGSSFWRKEVLGTLLDNEKRMSQPGNVEAALINSNNHEMKLDAVSRENLNGRDCLVLDITPRRNSEYLFNGKLWVDAHDYSIVQLKGTASKSAFFLAKAAAVSRQYTSITGLPMATRAEAVSGSALLGQTTVKIDYTNYQIDLDGSHQAASATSERSIHAASSVAWWKSNSPNPQLE
jgi:hypothetical protein